MTIIAQQKTEQVSNDTYELFEVVEMELEDGTTANVKKSLGTYSLAQLEREKANHQTRMDSVQEKIDVIEAL